jgi:hypothetical protein
MIIARVFDGDNDHLTKHVQHDLYDAALTDIAFVCRDAYLRAARVIGAEDDKITLAIARIELFDHRTLQAAHDHLAAYWRSLTGRTHPMLPGLFDAVAVGEEWRRWLRREVGNWWVDFPELIRFVCGVLANQNTETGYLAEARVAALLRSVYPLPGHEPA